MAQVDYAGLNAALDEAFPNRDWHDKCEAFRFQATRLTNGLASMRSFDSAKIARNNSKIIDKNRAAATVGQVGFWDKTSYEHDMLSLGSDLWIGATGLGDIVADLGGGIKVIHGSTYPATFLGRAENVAGNPKALLLPYPVPAASAPASGAAWAFNPPSNDIQKRIQVAMAKRGRYKGKQNGVWGQLSIAGIQLTAENVGYKKGYTPGVPGPLLCHFVQVYAAKFGGYKGPINGILGPNGWLGFCRGLEAGLR